MIKKLTILLSAIVIMLAVATFLGWAAYQNEQYIASIESELNVALTEVAWLEAKLEDKEDELAETKERLLISNDQLKMIEMRNEGMEYKEGAE